MKRAKRSLGLTETGPKDSPDGKYNEANPLEVKLTYRMDEQQGGWKMVAKKYTIERYLLNDGESERDVIKVTFFGTGDLKVFTAIYPLEYAKILAACMNCIMDGAAYSGTGFLDW